MQKLNHIQNIYLIGIGGIGMSALARYFKAMGKNVAGYDRKNTDLTQKLAAEGIAVSFRDEVEDIPEEFKVDKNALVIFTPAVPAKHPQYRYFLDKGYALKKRAEVLGDITKDIFTLAVAGTHGKTTTTAILAHLLKASGAEVSAFLGGISENYQSNLVLSGNEVVVVEADEYDRSFLRLSPNIAAITSMDADHLDIYGKAEELEASFSAFANLLPSDGILFFKKGLPLQGTSISVEEDADITAENIRIENGNYLFDLNFRGELIKGFSFGLPGKHNLFNAITALAMALTYGMPAESLKNALKSFRGVSRRFSYKIKTEELVLIDDYAHHPEEIKAVHQAVREMHPGKNTLVVFQPHLFSRTRDFADEFARRLDEFDQVMLLEIYPAREEPIEGITAFWLLEKLKNPNKKLVEKAELAEKIKEAGAQVVLLVGAGDIGEEVETIKEALQDEI